MRHPGNMEIIMGACLLVLIASAALLAPWIAPRNPLSLDLTHMLAPPSSAYPLGTDQLGRCVLSRVIYGARLSVTGAFSASLIALFLGGLTGIGAASKTPWVGKPITGIIDMAFALPGLILALVCAGLMGPSMESLILGLTLGAWPWWARFFRGLVLSAREKEYVPAGQVAGLRNGRLLVRYILPQLKGPVLTAFALKTGWMILAFSGLSYLGLGPAPPAPEWGSMLQESAIYMTRAPWLMIAPGLAVSLAVLSLNLLGEGWGNHDPQ